MQPGRWAWPRSPHRTSVAAMAAATSSGWATAVSRISSAPAVVPAASRSHPARSDQAVRRSANPGSSSHAVRKPGACAPCPGAAKTSMYLPCTVELCHKGAEKHEFLRSLFGAFLQPMFACELCSLVDQAPQHDGDPEGETAPALRRDEPGQLADPAQAVADRVGVHEQHPGGRLQREALLQVGHHGVDERRAAAEQGLVD